MSPPAPFDFPAHGLPAISEPAHARLARLLELRGKWNRTHDLVGPAAAADPWRVDVCDAVAVAAVMEAERPLVDVGAGGGVPGLMVACLRPDLRVVLVEPRVKRVAFLRAAKRALGLGSVAVVRGRWPDDVALDSPVQVVSRAVVSPAVWPALAASGGVCVSDFIRMLAVERPPVELAGWRASDALDYREGPVERRVERWTRLGSAG